MQFDEPIIEKACMDAIAALCIANKGSFDVSIPEWFPLDAGGLYASIRKGGLIRFTYSPEGKLQ
jgi:hypothetical protein